MGEVQAENKIRVITHIAFEIGMVLKSVDGILEILSGLFMTLINPVRLNNIMHILTRHELSEDPRDAIAGFLLSAAHSFSISTQALIVTYLISHGIAKCVLMALMWKKKIWAYPLTISVLLLFIAYQIYRFTVTPSMALVLLSMLDGIMIALTYYEYRRISHSTCSISTGR